MPNPAELISLCEDLWTIRSGRNPVGLGVVFSLAAYFLALFGLIAGEPLWVAGALLPAAAGVRFLLKARLIARDRESVRQQVRDGQDRAAKALALQDEIDELAAAPRRLALALILGAVGATTFLNALDGGYTAAAVLGLLPASTTGWLARVFVLERKKRRELEQELNRLLGGKQVGGSLDAGARAFLEAVGRDADGARSDTA
jgi:membrane protein implicated in regulation of membrane protease activity